MCFDAKARDSFAKDTARKEKCVAGTSARIERIKFIDKDNKHTDYPMCGAEESWKHVVFMTKESK